MCCCLILVVGWLILADCGVWAVCCCDVVVVLCSLGGRFRG